MLEFFNGGFYFLDMTLLYPNSDGHFDAEISLYSSEKAGRKHPAVNGIMWNLTYAKDLEDNGAKALQSYVWPEFLDNEGKTIPKTVPLCGILTERMHIIVPEMIDVHMKRLNIGTKFFCMEGPRPQGEGTVTAIG